MLLALDKNRLRWLLAGLFAALAIPTALLIRHAYSQLRADALQQYQQRVRVYAGQLDASLHDAMAVEDALGPGDFAFFVESSDQSRRERSKLSAFPVAGSLPGTVGYFQVDAAGVLTTPLLPEDGVELSDYGIGAEEEADRKRARQRLSEVLANNRLAVRRAPPAPPAAAGVVAEQKAAADAATSFSEAAPLARQRPAVSADVAAASTGPRAVGQAVFDELGSAVANEPRAARLAPEIAADSLERSAEQPLEEAVVTAVRVFADEVEAFQFNRLASGEFVIFRNVWQDGSRLVQGALIDDSEFVERAIGAGFRLTESGLDGSLRVFFAGQPLAEIARAGDSEPASGDSTAVAAERLSPPFADLELAFAPDRLTAGPASTLLAWLSLIIFAVLSSGFWLLYRMLAGQIELAEQQRNFVSAVSHELKTPLTSIRMYGEMLAAGWADEEKRHGYYRYILDESERLSRLIDNVLRLAGLGHGASALRIESVPVAELLDLVRSRVTSQLEAAQYALELNASEAVAGLLVSVDKDAFVQIMINLVDNAIKYSKESGERRVAIGAEAGAGDTVVFAVRDYGPGVPRAKMKRLFDLFYRPRDERTRAVQGTGIGLALVRELAVRMGGRVDVRNCEPGAEFSVELPARR